MKVSARLVALSSFITVSAMAATVGISGNTQFISTVQFMVQEPTPDLLNRSQRLVREQFAASVEAFPRLSGAPYQQRVLGNEVVFYLTTNDDMGAVMQEALSGMIQNLNRRVRTRGLLPVYRTMLTQPVENMSGGGYLETAVDNSHTGVVSIVAQSVPLRDVLKQLKTQLTSLSYLVPGECADRRVKDWRFGKTEEGIKTVDAVMKDLAGLFNLKVEKKNDTHIFTGSCQDAPNTTTSSGPLLAQSPFIPISATTPMEQQVYFPLRPLAEVQ